MSEGLERVRAVLEFLEHEPAPPWEIGALHLAADGRIVRRHGEMPLRFGFRCLGIPVTGLVERGTDVDRLSLRAVLGSVPFTGESAEARRRVLHRIRTAGGLLATDGREVSAQLTELVPRPQTPEALLARLAGFMLALKPEIEALVPCLPGQHGELAA